MLFVPLPLFATLVLCLVLIRLLVTRDMRVPAHRVFALLVALYAGQSLLLCLRWGYDVVAIGPVIALIAPCLPACAYLAYLSLAQRLNTRALMPLGVVPVNWLLFLVQPALADLAIPLTYVGFGAVLLRRAWAGTDALPLSRLGEVSGALRAMRLTGVALVASAVTDAYLIYDFIRNDGQMVGLIVTFVQTGFILVIGLSAALGQSAVETTAVVEPETAKPIPSSEDHEIVARLEALFDAEGLHRNEDLTVRRLARRLGLPDRSVSGAVNRIKGVNVSQFVNDFRVREACRLLAETDKSVLEVSLASGFATKSNFNREFARVTGKTPTGWRQAQGSADAGQGDPD